MKTSIQLSVYDPLTSMSNKGAFLQDVLVVARKYWINVEYMHEM